MERFSREWPSELKWLAAGFSRCWCLISDPLKCILDKHSSILNVYEKLRQLAVRDPALVAYRHPPSLRTLVVSTQFAQKQQLLYKGNSWCWQVHCKPCWLMQSVKTFKSSVTGKTYSIKATANCRTANVVYVIDCIKCKKRYARETENSYTCEWTAMDRILSIDVWKSQWLINSIVKTTFWRIFLFLWLNISTRRRLTFAKQKRATGSRLWDCWSRKELTLIHRPQNWNNDGPIDTVFHKIKTMEQLPLLCDTFGQLRLVGYQGCI